ncbi:MAG: SDR family oxidoreductase [Jatrophihabitans sp.]|uniref:SDR family oxidoreductase n=1 Tax=Jatrophihabitans sp. TaxID=1932789 RepID=UPI003F7DEEF4
MARSKDLTGSVALVTGGARGIGAATARALARDGVRVAIADLDLELAERTAKDIGGAVAYQLDVTDSAAFTAVLDAVEHDLGPLDILINNAGIMPVVEFDEESAASIDRQIAINLRAVVHGSQEAVRRMKPRGRGHLVNVASAAGKFGFPGVATYCATKHAVVGLSEALHLELHGTGIEVSCVMPAIVRTELTDGVKDHPLMKSSSPEDVAAAILDALHRPHFDVYVPKAINGMTKVMRLFPRGPMEAFGRLVKSDTVMIAAAHAPERDAYEKRAAGL